MVVGKGGAEAMELEGFTDASAFLRSGVYALCKKGQVIYVGKSKAMIARVNAHRRAYADRKKRESWVTEVLGIPGLHFDEVHVLPCPLHLLDALERQMIDKYKPRYNIQLQSGQKIRAPITVVVAGQSITLNQSPERVLRR